MSDGRRTPAPPPRRVAGIASAVVVMVGLILFVGTLFTGDDEPPDHPPALTFDTRAGPLASEAGAFRLSTGDLAVRPSAEADRPAHARTLEMARTIRAYPGAPPRIPHGLTDREFREGTCNNCHERGGFVARFGTYAPVTPHPEYGACLQCHAPRDALVGIPTTAGRGNESCGQCHVDPGAPAPTFVTLDWRTTAWPETDRRAMEGSPHWIPHDVQLRSNCVACHVGPGAEREIRTDHPERSACRQCHVPVTEARPRAFPEAASDRQPGPGGTP